MAIVVIAAAYFGYTYWMKKKAETAGDKDSETKNAATKTPTPKASGAAAGFDGSLSEMMGV